MLKWLYLGALLTGSLEVGLLLIRRYRLPIMCHLALDKAEQGQYSSWSKKLVEFSGFHQEEPKKTVCM